jgi:hypothetical protein
MHDDRSRGLVVAADVHFDGSTAAKDYFEQSESEAHRGDDGQCAEREQELNGRRT